jgi:hypothetical protein
MNNHFLETSIQEFKKYKTLGDKAIAQLHSDNEMHWKPGAESNSMAIIIRHLHGNMISRWTDFLTSDGEKPTRMRDNEFIDTKESKEELIRLWDEGWNCVFNALEPLTESHLMQQVMIRNEPHTVMQAVIRQLAHYCSHVGQMIYLAKQIRDSDWQTLSIPRNKSEEFNRKMMK